MVSLPRPVGDDAGDPASPTPPAGQEDWRAPTADGPLAAVVPLPGSKSLTNRALVLAALADGRSRLRRPLRSPRHPADGGRRCARSAWGRGRRRRRRRRGRHGRLAGHPPAAARREPARRRERRHGHALPAPGRGARRPPGGASTATRRSASARWARSSARSATLGAGVDDDGRGALPFTVVGTGRRPGGGGRPSTRRRPPSSSPPCCSPAPGYDARRRPCDTPARRVPSAPHLAMTVDDAARRRGVDVDDSEPGTWRVEPGALSPGRRRRARPVQRRARSWRPPLVAGGTVRSPAGRAAPPRPGDALRDVLDGWAPTCRLDRGGLTVSGGGTASTASTPTCTTPAS